MQREDVEVIEREACFSGFYKLDRLRLRHRQFAGGMGPELSPIASLPVAWGLS
jgi:ADP-ribose pyrophosphatase